jgi:hypothetical protein
VIDADGLETEPEAEAGHGVEATKGESRPIDRHAWERKRDVIAAALGRREGTPLIRKSAAVYWSADHSLRAALVVSKRYTDKGNYRYWYGYRKQWYEFLHEAKRGYLVLGCMDRDEAFTIPISALDPLLDKLYTTSDESEIYHWHLQLNESASGEVSLLVPKQEAKLPLSGYLLNLEG